MDPTKTELGHALARLNARAWGIAGGLTFGIGLFAATNVLLIIGPAPGTEVGQTLGQLRYFFPGYSVTFIGSLIGLMYGFVVGYALGRGVGLVYNRLVEDPWQ